MSWEMVKLSEVSSFIRNGLSIKQDSSLSGVPITRIETISDRTVNLEKCGYADLKPTDNLDYKLEKGDILISHINSPKHLGKSAQFHGEEHLIHGMNLLCLRPSDKVDARYLYLAINSSHFLNQLPNISNKSVNQASFKVSDFKSLNVHLPPLPEQQRIANILDKAEAINQKRAQVLVLCDEFLRATFLDMFGHHFSSKGYPSSTKKSIALLTDYIDYRGKTPKKTEYGIPLITAKNVRKGYVDEEPREFISEDLYDDWMTRGLPLKNDVLFTTEAPLGNVALLGEYEKVAVGQRLVSLRCKEEVTPIYFMYALLDRYTQQLIFQRSSGSTVKGIRTKELYQIEIPTPPIELQQKFSSIVEKINGIKTRIQEAQELPLFDALSQQAFKGELTL